MRQSVLSSLGLVMLCFVQNGVRPFGSAFTDPLLGSAVASSSTSEDMKPHLSSSDLIDAVAGEILPKDMFLSSPSLSQGNGQNNGLSSRSNSDKDLNKDKESSITPPPVWGCVWNPNASWTPGLPTSAEHRAKLDPKYFLRLRDIKEERYNPDCESIDARSSTMSRERCRRTRESGASTIPDPLEEISDSIIVTTQVTSNPLRFEATFDKSGNPLWPANEEFIEPEMSTKDFDCSELTMLQCLRKYDTFQRFSNLVDRNTPSNAAFRTLLNTSPATRNQSIERRYVESDESSEGEHEKGMAMETDDNRTGSSGRSTGRSTERSVINASSSTSVPASPRASGEATSIVGSFSTVGSGEAPVFNSVLSSVLGSSKLNGQTLFVPSNRAMEHADSVVLNGTGFSVTERWVASTLNYSLLYGSFSTEMIPVGAFAVLKTHMNDSDMVNLGPSRPQNVVVHHNPYTKGVELMYGVFHARATTARVIGKDIRCKNGHIHIIDKLMTLPESSQMVLRSAGYLSALSAITFSGFDMAFGIPLHTLVVARNNIVEKIISTIGQTISSSDEDVDKDIDPDNDTDDDDDDDNDKDESDKHRRSPPLTSGEKEEMERFRSSMGNKEEIADAVAAATSSTASTSTSSNPTSTGRSSRSNFEKERNLSRYSFNLRGERCFGRYIRDPENATIIPCESEVGDRALNKDELKKLLEESGKTIAVAPRGPVMVELPASTSDSRIIPSEIGDIIKTETETETATETTRTVLPTTTALAPTTTINAPRTATTTTTTTTNTPTNSPGNSSTSHGPTESRYITTTGANGGNPVRYLSVTVDGVTRYFRTLSSSSEEVPAAIVNLPSLPGTLPDTPIDISTTVGGGSTLSTAGTSVTPPSTSTSTSTSTTTTTTTTPSSSPIRTNESVGDDGGGAADVNTQPTELESNNNTRRQTRENNTRNGQQQIRQLIQRHFFPGTVLLPSMIQRKQPITDSLGQKILITEDVRQPGVYYIGGARILGAGLSRSGIVYFVDDVISIPK